MLNQSHDATIGHDPPLLLTSDGFDQLIAAWSDVSSSMNATAETDPTRGIPRSRHRAALTCSAPMRDKPAERAPVLSTRRVPFQANEGHGDKKSEDPRR